MTDSVAVWVEEIRNNSKKTVEILTDIAASVRYDEADADRVVVPVATLSWQCPVCKVEHDVTKVKPTDVVDLYYPHVCRPVGSGGLVLHSTSTIIVHVGGYVTLHKAHAVALIRALWEAHPDVTSVSLAHDGEIQLRIVARKDPTDLAALETRFKDLARRAVARIQGGE